MNVIHGIFLQEDYGIPADRRRRLLGLKSADDSRTKNYFELTTLAIQVGDCDTKAAVRLDTIRR